MGIRAGGGLFTSEAGVEEPRKGAMLKFRNGSVVLNGREVYVIVLMQMSSLRTS